LPEGSRVLMLWETRSLYCLPKCDPDEVIDRWIHDVRTYGTAERIVASWRGQGYTNLLISLDGEIFLRESESKISLDDWTQLDKLRSQLPPPTKFGESYSLFTLSVP